MAKRREWGRIRKLPSGRWQARYPGPDGVLRPAPETFETRNAAASWLADKQSEINRDEWIDPDAGKITLAEYGTKWIKERPLEETTRERYESAFRLHVMPYLGDLALKDIKPARVRTWWKDLVDKKVGQPTRAKAYRVLRVIMNTAVSDQLVRSNPCKIKKASADGSAERPTLTIDEVFAVADAIKPRYRALVLLGGFTSLRFGELAALTRGDLDIEAGDVSVSKSQADLRGGRRVIKGPKSEAGIRVVSIPKVIRPELVKHLEEYVGEASDSVVFVGPKGGRLHRHNLRKLWLAALEAAKIKKDVHFHDLRHTGNDLAAKAGATTKELMSRMGHASMRAALIYQHASRERDQAIADKISRNVTKARRAKEKGHAKGTPDEKAS